MARSVWVLLFFVGGCASEPTMPPPSDGAREVEAPPPVTCGERATLPAGVSREGETYVVRCGERGVRLAVVEPSVVRVRRSAEPPARPSWAVVDAGGAPSSAGASDSALVVCTGALTATVRTDDCRVRVAAADGVTLLEDVDPALPTAVRLHTPAGEHLYGLGGRTGRLDRRGRRTTLWNTDAYDPAFKGYRPDADLLYTSIPFVVALRDGRAHGLFSDDTFRQTWDLAATDPEVLQIEAQGGVLDQYVFDGPTLAEVLARYTRLTGRAALVPRWTLGYHQSRWGYSPATRVEDVAAELRRRKLPADGMWLDIQHMDGFRSFTWNPTTFGDPDGLIARLAAQGFQTTIIVDPGIKVDPGWEVYQAGMAGGHFLPHVGEVWPGKAAFPDFSRAATRAWWAELIARPLARGVRGIWIDMNEPSSFEPGGTVPDAVPADGDGVPTTMAEVHNAYGLLEARASYEGLRAARPGERPFLLSRAGYAGLQRYAGVWTGDAPSRWDVLADTLPMLLGLGLSGLVMVGSDVGGYSGEADAEMFARWMQLGAISPFLRAHTMDGAKSQEPWEFGLEVEDVSRAALIERYRLMPYLYTLLHEAAETGAPILRPLVWHFQSDPTAAALDDEAMLGPSLLYAPVLEAGATTRRVYLPAGRWYDAWSDAVYEGPATVEVDLRLASLPAFVRAGAIVPRAELVQHDGERTAALDLDVYPADAPSAFTLVEDAGDGYGAPARTTYTLEPTATGLKITAARVGAFAVPERAVTVRVHRVDHAPRAVRLDGAAHPDASWDENARLYAVRLEDRPGFQLAIDYQRTLVSPAPAVALALEVEVPADTPRDAPITVATSAAGWAHHPLDWDPVLPVARGQVTVPRGAWVEYKYTRGGWSTVEKYAGCAEAKNRYALGAAAPRPRDVVATWADRCP